MIPSTISRAARAERVGGGVSSKSRTTVFVLAAASFLSSGMRGSVSDIGFESGRHRDLVGATVEAGTETDFDQEECDRRDEICDHQHERQLNKMVNRYFLP